MALQLPKDVMQILVIIGHLSYATQRVLMKRTLLDIKYQNLFDQAGMISSHLYIVFYDSMPILIYYVEKYSLIMHSTSFNVYKA